MSSEVPLPFVNIIQPSVKLPLVFDHLSQAGVAREKGSRKMPVSVKHVYFLAASNFAPNSNTICLASKQKPALETFISIE